MVMVRDGEIVNFEPNCFISTEGRESTPKVGSISVSISAEEFRNFLDTAEQALNGKALRAPRTVLRNAIKYYRDKGY